MTEPRPASAFQRSFYATVEAPGCSRRFSLLSAYLPAYALHVAGLAAGGAMLRKLDADQRARWRAETRGHGHIKAWVDIRTGTEVRECLACEAGDEQPITASSVELLERAIGFHRRHRVCSGGILDDVGSSAVE